MNYFHDFLIRHRVYCCRDLCYRRGTTVRQINGRDEVLCSEHAGRLDAVRKSDKKQESKIP